MSCCTFLCLAINQIFLDVVLFFLAIHCVVPFVFLMILRPPRSTRTDTLFPYTTLFRSYSLLCPDALRQRGGPGRPFARDLAAPAEAGRHRERSEEHTSKLQSLMRISYAVFCLKKKKHKKINNNN